MAQIWSKIDVCGVMVYDCVCFVSLETGKWSPKIASCIDRNECLEKPCKGEGTVICLNTIGSFLCQCESGYEKVDQVTCKGLLGSEADCLGFT